jgi:hypothetical protein
MEQVGPRAPLEQEMMRQSRQVTQVTGGTTKFPLFALPRQPFVIRISSFVIPGLPLLLFACLLTPLFISAHGTEFIMARLRLVDNESALELRLGIDYLGNPMIADEAAARAALQEALHVRHGEKTTRFTDLAPLTLESSSSWDDTMPDSLQPPDDGQPHQVMIGTWRWQADAQHITFTVAKGNRNDVLLWQQAGVGEVKSTMLLGGDVSPALTVAPPPTLRSKLWMIPASVLAGIIVIRFKRRRTSDQASSLTA